MAAARGYELVRKALKTLAPLVVAITCISRSVWLWARGYQDMLVIIPNRDVFGFKVRWELYRLVLTAFATYNYWPTFAVTFKNFRITHG